MKNALNREALHKDALIMKSVYDQFNVDEFVDTTIDQTWDELELKAREKRIGLILGKYLPDDYEKALGLIDKVVERHALDILVMGYPFLEFVEAYGLDEKNLHLSIRALRKYTPYWSSEFAIRAFIIKYEVTMMKQMYQWSKDEDEHIRRLSSEGCRPRLPWAKALTSFQQDPTPVLTILEQLKSDPSKYVRKSVANNLNDISKTHPQLVTKLAKDWYGQNEHTDWIIKHGCRTLLKKGNTEVLAIFGYHDVNICVDRFVIETDMVPMGEELVFSFEVHAKEVTKIRLEYGIDYVKSNGKTSRKIYKISEGYLDANTKKEYRKIHSFAELSTRTHYPGLHSITLIVNGVEREKLDFELVKL